MQLGLQLLRLLGCVCNLPPPLVQIMAGALQLPPQLLNLGRRLRLARSRAPFNLCNHTAEYFTIVLTHRNR